MSNVNDIRSKFLSYFSQNGHEEVSSSPLVPENDPTLMFTNAGMVQFKNVFTGMEHRDYQRAVTSQKCVRAGGKHNDLENVGYTARHHTFFEMLGNFSFGDYFKDQAIEFAWNLITKEYALNPNKMLVTVYHEDEEALSLWKKIAGLSDDRIIRISTSDNFWSMGDLGPCGPCSEIFYDHGEHIPGGPPGSADEDGDRFIEIWNLVFMQYEQTKAGRINLPKPSIDTGMGLERIAAVLQGKHDNYDIDLMRALVEASAQISKTEVDGQQSVSHRVVADHLRSVGFLIADGVLPSNEGRGYVLRRIMRRAMRHLHQLGCEEPVMHKLVPSLVQEMGGHYPELYRAEALISQTIELEETRFKDTLSRGLKILQEELYASSGKKILAGSTAFKLYDTYGFPLDLTQDYLRGYDWQVDVDGFDKAMLAQKNAARAAWIGSGGKIEGKIFLELADKNGGTEFLGYNQVSSQGVVTNILSDNTQINRASQNDDVIIITNQTPFYAESGGQVGDVGSFSWQDGAASVHNTTKTASLFLHHCKITKGSLSPGQPIQMDIDISRRDSLRANHSATHLLHEALRLTLGDHVAQKGSLVAPDRLRFDFSHNEAVKSDKLDVIEDIVNHHIQMNSPVDTRIMTPEMAIAEGAMALFGEKYGDEVRVVTMGGEDVSHNKSAWSVELCGGTHVNRTGDIGSFKIISESAVAGGVRRIEAVSQNAARRWFSERETILDKTATLLKSKIELVPDRVANLLIEKKKLEAEITQLRQKIATGGFSAENRDSEKIGNTTFIGRIVEDTPAKELKPLADQLRLNATKTVICLAAIQNDKISIVVALTPDCEGEHDAVGLVRIAADAIGGTGGGGRFDMAQAGGNKPENANAALESVRQALAQ
ncbi:MAG: alanine--tRNA ligase [Alphaproteobacteria bacterium]|mgnify:FL=1|jgi:alanyl-tRNA synthetase|nr:alanine--tRNA ligase [Alphaproteobacteria bacterium]